MASPDDRRYLATHEWHRLDGGRVTVGLSQFAVDELTDITFLDIRKRQGPIKAGESFGEIESVKATSELYAGIDGNVVEVNQQAVDDPAIVNRDPYGAGWLVRIEPSDPAQLDALMSAADYDRQHG